MLHLKQWHYSLHRDFQNCYSTRRSPTGFFNSNSSSNAPILQGYPYTIHIHMCTLHYTTIQRILHPESNSTYRRQRALRVLLLHPEGKETFIPDIPVFPDIPDTPVITDIPDIPVVPDIPDIPVIHDLPAFPGNSTSSSISRESNPFQHSPIRMHILQFDWFPQKTPPSTS